MKININQTMRHAGWARSRTANTVTAHKCRRDELKSAISKIVLVSPEDKPEHSAGPVEQSGPSHGNKYPVLADRMTAARWLVDKRARFPGKGPFPTSGPPCRLISAHEGYLSSSCLWIEELAG